VVIATVVWFGDGGQRERKMLEDAILEALKTGGPGTAQEINDRLSHCVYATLKRLVAAEKVREVGFPGRGNPKTYSLPKAAPINGQV
jgi:chromosome segregation and condensation protein ScpB